MDFLQLERGRPEYANVLDVTDIFAILLGHLFTDLGKATIVAKVLWENETINYGFPHRPHSYQERDLESCDVKQLYKLASMQKSWTTSISFPR